MITSKRNWVIIAKGFFLQHINEYIGGKDLQEGKGTRGNGIVQGGMTNNAVVVLTLDFCFRITQYIEDTHNARTLIPMNTRMQTLTLGDL
jgi:hypothetical protein